MGSTVLQDLGLCLGTWDPWPVTLSAACCTEVGTEWRKMPQGRGHRYPQHRFTMVLEEQDL